ncbi:hypothetical protein L2E82_21156 [Cichorium intybus]|uniref:Uncharacterized protein n=1 Tax=Cichorium intybus TaxID=13427 RepID=A0ACB9DVD3_CICIN|nr:hypothetical protein L2E82_21156 [Cichorium intybus]
MVSPINRVTPLSLPLTIDPLFLSLHVSRLLSNPNRIYRDNRIVDLHEIAAGSSLEESESLRLLKSPPLLPIQLPHRSPGNLSLAPLNQIKWFG